MFNTHLNINKIGNTIVYLIEMLGPTYMTKLIKLLYILDEASIKHTGVPFTWLDYKVWKNGPVPNLLYYFFRNSNSSNLNELTRFIQVEPITNPKSPDKDAFIINKVSDFNDEEFSDYELDLMKQVILNYGHLSGSQLIEILHETDSLWHQMTTKHDLVDYFNSFSNTSNYSIPFEELIIDNELKIMAFKSAAETKSFL